MADASLPHLAADGTDILPPGPTFGPASVGWVGPPSLEQVIRRARARLAERERLGAKLLSFAVIFIAFPFMVDLMGLSGVIPAQLRLTTSPMLRDAVAGWSVTAVDAGAVLLEVVLMAGALAGASRFNAGRPKAAWMFSVLGAVGLILWVPVLWGTAVEVFPTDWMTGLWSSLLPALGFAGCVLIVVGGLEARLRPVRPYDR